MFSPLSLPPLSSVFSPLSSVEPSLLSTPISKPVSTIKLSLILKLVVHNLLPNVRLKFFKGYDRLKFNKLIRLETTNK